MALDVEADKSMQEKIDNSAVSGDKLEAVVAAAKGLGYDFTVAELKEALVAQEDLSLDELENVAGGYSKTCQTLGDGYLCYFVTTNCICSSLFT